MKFRFLTAGESHGKCLTAIVEGIPAGIEIDPDDINKQLARRQQGYGRGGRMQIEKDKVIINSGIRHGFTTGAPVTLVIENKDWENWTVPMSAMPVDLENPEIMELIEQKKITHVRPGHADLTGALKYNHEDIRNILERSSARETAIRVAVGALAQIILNQFGVEIFSHVVQIGTAKVEEKDLPKEFLVLKEKAENSDVRCADEKTSEEMRKIIDKAAGEGDSLGGIFEIIALNYPIGLGSFVHWDRRLDGQIAQTIMSIPAIKSVSIGLGENSGTVLGSEMHDEIFPMRSGSESRNGCDEQAMQAELVPLQSNYQRKTNNAGGIEGGMSNGMPIIVKAAMKPIPTLKKPLRSIDLETGREHTAHYERSDVCAVPAASVVGEAMLAIALISAFLEKFGGDSLIEMKSNFENYKKLYQSR
ncbi:MAG TPA: chorismate synthase [Cyanobacteria bacterium UBA9971]|nr:chorismate synthase [Cyanobacteria bacterium UBA9971]